jgi:two-component system, OmpR family, response regulator RegX3
MRIAILEDDPSQLELFGHWLALAGHDPQRFEHGGELLTAIGLEDFDVLILDWNLPGLSGIDVLRQVRQGSKLPVIFCTSRDGQDDVVTALREGADDYLSKPVRRMELLGRIESVARRARRMHAKAEAFQVDCFHVDPADRTITRDGALLELTDKDFDLAVLFLSNVGRLLSRSYIHKVIWGANGCVTSRTMDTDMSRIRGKLGLVYERGWELKAAYGHGYRLEQTRPPALLSSPIARNERSAQEEL